MNGLACLLVLAVSMSTVFSTTTTSRSPSEGDGESASDVKEELEQLRKAVADLSKQVMLQQTSAEERIRTEGSSGISIVRGGKKGRKNYDTNSHLSPAAFAIHDHSNYDRTVGLGEMAVVMNGVAFTTRHNDYKLVMASRTSGEHHAVEDIPFPDVPSEVLNKTTVQEQVDEMREWFKAFHKQDKSVRDYTKYFKPVMCYIEGAWMSNEVMEEPFPSDRHWLDATSWEDLHKKHRFTAYTGVKHRLENIASLPTTIVSVNMSTGVAKYAQWNYRILCSPVDTDIPLSHFHQEDDLSYRVTSGQTMKEAAMTRVARYKLYDDKRRRHSYQIMDEIFATIPGKNNHGGNLTFSVFAEEMYNTEFSDSNTILNTAYYHRAYKSGKNGAGGTTHASLGFNDENMWVAQTTQPLVAPMEAEQCEYVQIRVGRFIRQCINIDIRVSYAIPLEIIFMTPLLSWNPYNLTIHNDIKTSFLGGRNGGLGAQAFDGIDKIRYYMTPVELFSGPLDRSDPADTMRGYVHVTAPDGEVKRVSSSGTRIMLQDIQGIGQLRLRYPIAPVHDEGSSVWKELNALRDRLLNNVAGAPTYVLFEMSLTTQEPPGEHIHEMTVSYDEFTLLLQGHRISVTTEEAQGHRHTLTLLYVHRLKSFRYIYCDGLPACRDGHPVIVTLETKNAYTKLP